MSFIETANKRYSVRKFSDKEIEPEILKKVLEAGQMAPTAKNLQPQRIYVLQGKEAIEKLAVLTPCVFNAKTVLVFTYNKDEEWHNPFEEGVRSGVEDVSIAATYIMLQAADLGLGTCWCNYFPNTKAEQALGIPDNERTVLFMPIGYPAEDSEPSPRHSEKRPLEETVKYM